jgi:succinate dehydrogenase / fumarate reductase iron-sulfur subunit
MEPFFEACLSIKPFLITDGREPTRERLQSAKDRERFDDTTKCILCAACTTSCPVFCTDACPRGIEVTKAIQEVKRALIFRRV